MSEPEILLDQREIITKINNMIGALHGCARKIGRDPNNKEFRKLMTDFFKDIEDCRIKIPEYKISE